MSALVTLGEGTEEKNCSCWDSDKKKMTVIWIIKKKTDLDNKKMTDSDKKKKTL